MCGRATSIGIWTEQFVGTGERGHDQVSALQKFWIRHETVRYVGHGTPVTIVDPDGPASYPSDTGIPATPGHYNTTQLLGFTPPPGVSAPPHTLSNFALLLKTLDVFYRRNKKAPYLPNIITAKISLELAEIITAVATISTGADEPATAAPPEVLYALLQKMDVLYAYCLQYGLISFGFSTKVAQEQVDLIVASVASVELQKSEAERKIDEAFARLVITVDAASIAKLNAGRT